MGAVENTFVAYVLDQLSEMEGLGCRAMFGGHGLYQGGTFFGIVSGGRLYFKTGQATAGDYASRGMQPFHPNDKLVLKTYYEVPPDVLEDRGRLLAWALAAVRCAASAARGGGSRGPAPELSAETGAPPGGGRPRARSRT